MLLMIEKGIKEEICYTIYHHEKDKNIYVTDYDKNKETSYFKYWHGNNILNKQYPKIFL